MVLVVFQMPTTLAQRADKMLLSLSQHVDIAVQARYKYRNQLDKIDLDDANFPLHVNIPRLRQGKLGGLFWSA